MDDGAGIAGRPGWSQGSGDNPDPSSAKLQVNHLSVRFPLGRGIVQALDDVSLTLRSGQFCAVVGPSGCGKSTLLRVIAGLTPPTSGEVRIARSSQATPLQAMVFQGRSVFPWMTVLENAAYGLEMRGVSRIEREEIAERWLTRSGSAISCTPIRRNSPRACASASRSCAPSPSIRSCF